MDYYILINKMTAKPGKRDEVIDIMLEAGKPFETNNSCLLYLISKSVEEENALWVQDIWTNEADHEAAMSTPEMAKYIKQAMPLLEGMPEQISVEPVGGAVKLSK